MTKRTDRGFRTLEPGYRDYLILLRPGRFWAQPQLCFPVPWQMHYPIVPIESYVPVTNGPRSTPLSKVSGALELSAVRVVFTPIPDLIVPYPFGPLRMADMDHRTRTPRPRTAYAVPISRPVVLREALVELDLTAINYLDEHCDDFPDLCYMGGTSTVTHQSGTLRFPPWEALQSNS
ncbi:hypothetical protein CPB83DRAFT_900796 [Crepidotus variabilis]|uniref:Uncharacterized protein n=1 Tax=Crepidotus variabilis TaxID=179855 RepID=A0A9P6BBW9_9AGAR|nr:hypothetical protein CPB83DRAFT_900796 [Crepidotus variabilis]